MVEGTLDTESKVSDLNPHSLTDCMVLDRLLLCLRLQFSQLQREGSPYSLLLLLLLLLLSRFSRVPTLCDPIASSLPGSSFLGFSRQEHWSGLPFPSPVHESEK